jgi:integrase
VLDVLRRIEATGSNEVAHRVRQRLGQIFRYAIATSRATRDPTADLRGALAPLGGDHFASITDPGQVGALLRAIDGYTGFPATKAALSLAPLVFVRPGELRAAEWSEFDAYRAEWRIPAARMKMQDEHVVPLSRQALAILEELRPITGRGRLVFPSVRSPARPVSDNTVNAALRRLGYTSDEIVGHGFRAMASAMLNEMGYPPDVVERQLAHKERSKVRAAYNRALYMAERRTMLQAWADYLDGLRVGGNVVPLLRGVR